jgi:alkylation response protein AidB-like acyl-CoA dehydrogenase
MRGNGPLLDIGERAGGTADEAGMVDWVGRAHALRPMLEAAAPRIDALRELPPDVLDALHDAGMFRLLVPKDLGGAELDLPTYVRVVEALAQADGSVAWCVGQGSGCSVTAAYLPQPAAWEMFGRDRRAVIAWGAGVNGQAVPVAGGFRVTGKWSFASGSRHANWLGGMCPIMDADGTRHAEPDGSAKVRTFVFPKAQCRVIDDWHVIGLRGTGSDSYAIADQFVPTEHQFLRTEPAPHPGALYRMPLIAMYPPSFAAVALGLARSVLDSFTAMARTKTPRGASPMLGNAAIQSLLGHSEARVRSARAFLHAALGAAVTHLNGGGGLAGEHDVSLRMCTTFAIQEAAAVVDTLYHEAGATAILAANPFERRFRDMHAVAQQVQGRRANFELVGQRLLGLPTGPLVF